jgi:hypothetical protein
MDTEIADSGDLPTREQIALENASRETSVILHMALKMHL